MHEQIEARPAPFQVEDDPGHQVRIAEDPGAAPTPLVPAQLECYTRSSAASRHPSRWRGAVTDMEEVVAVLHPDPFRDIDRLAAQLLGTAPGSARVPLAMPMDLYRCGDHYVLHADLPGVDPDSVDVSVDGGILTVTAQRSARTEHDVQWLSSERFTGAYLRRLSLGPDIDADHITATYHNGVLTVTLPVAARAQPRRIEITRGAREETKVIEPSDSTDQHTTT
jgi:HSP20 family protein